MTRIRYLTIFVMMLILASSASAEVRLALTTGEVRYFAEDVFMLKLDLAINEDTGFYGDVYLVAIDPNGTIYFAPGWQQDVKPVLENFFFPPAVDLKSALIIEQGVPNLSFPMTDLGQYVFAIGITSVGTTTFYDIGYCITEYKGEREWMVIDNEDGLKGYITSIMEDKNDGGYWFASYGGFSLSNPSIFHYKDGVLKGYTLYGSIVSPPSGMLYDSQDRFWVSSFGLNRYDPVNDLFINYLPPDYHPEDRNLYEAVNNGITYDSTRNIIWEGSVVGLLGFKLEDESWVYYDETAGLVSNEIKDMTWDNDGNLWIVGYNAAVDNPKGGVSKFDGTNFTNFYCEDFNIVFDQLMFNTIGLDNEGCIWVASNQFSDEPFSMKPHRYVNDKWVRFTVDDGLPSESIYSFYLDRFGKFWSTCYKGEPSYLAQFKDGKWFSVLPEIKNMGPERIYSIYQDSQNNYWFGGYPYYAIRWGSD